MDVARRIGERHHLGAQFGGLLAGVLGDVARAGDADGLPFERVVARGEHLLREVAGSVARGLGAQRAAAPVAALAGERAGEFVAQTLVLAEHEADFAAADADVARRNVGVLSDVTLQLGHKRLAEFHHLIVRLAFRVEVRAALAAAHRERREAVLEGLLESQELEDREVHRGVEADTALVGADGAVHLDAVAAVDFDFAFVVEPRHAENNHALGFGNAFQHLHLLQDRAGHDVRGQRFGHLADGLMEFRLSGIACNQPGHEVFDVLLGLFVHKRFDFEGVCICFSPLKIEHLSEFCNLFKNFVKYFIYPLPEFAYCLRGGWTSGIKIRNEK